MAYKILIPQDVAAEGKDFLISKGYEIKMGSGADEASIIADVQDCDAVLLRTAKLTSAAIKAAPKLKIIARHGVGYDNVDTAAAAENGVYVTNTPNALSDSVAEFTIASMLLLAKNILPCSKAEREGDYFYKNAHKGVDLFGKTLAIIGFGRIGRAVAKKALALDMNVIAYSPSLTQQNAPAGVEAVSLDEAYKRGDFVSLHLPSRPETKGSVNTRVFEMMKSSAFLISVARGDIVNEEDLASAIKQGKIKGAAVDVTNEEPTPLESPLFKLENVIMTPHMASNTQECMARMSLMAAEEIGRVLSGNAPKWPVNKPIK